jgi:hypothetical protein
MTRSWPSCIWESTPPITTLLRFFVTSFLTGQVMSWTLRSIKMFSSQRSEFWTYGFRSHFWHQIVTCYVTVAALPVTLPLAGKGVSCTGMLRHSRKRGHVTAVEGGVLHNVNTSHYIYTHAHKIHSSVQFHRLLVKSPHSPYFHVNSTTYFDHTRPSSGMYDNSRKLLYFTILFYSTWCCTSKTFII